MPVNTPYPLPRRTDSLNAPLPNAQLFVAIEDDLRDSMRVHRQGQEEDLREALSRMMARVDELSALLKSTYQTNSDLQTSLTLSQSNLKLALANNEMLEDALRRNSSSKDVGWRRSSRETTGGLTPTPTPTPTTEHRTSLDEQRSLESPDVDNAPSPSQDSRFFRFRFSSGRSTPTQGHSPPPGPSKSVLNGVRSPILPAVGHLTSASLPSLLPGTNSKELDDLKTELEAERSKLTKIVGEKRSLEGELESLSQALFEEANKMVASERIKRAEAEEELRQATAEKDALRAALKLLESENGQLRTDPAAAHSRSSSTAALKSPTHSDPSRPASPHADPASAPGSPAPLFVPPPHARLADDPDPRTSSPLPLPHPHLPSHLRSALFTRDGDSDAESVGRGATPPPLRTSTPRVHPSAPPPSAADVEAVEGPPWAAAAGPEERAAWGSSADAREGDEDDDEDDDEHEEGVVVLRNRPTAFSPPPQPMGSPWADE